MKFEVITQKDSNSKSFGTVFFISGIISTLIILSNISIKLGRISRYFEINYLCKTLMIEKSSSNFKKLSNLTNQTNKFKVWEFCREIVK